MPRPFLALLLLTTAAHAQPTLQPDEPASAFIERWNAWCVATDPDQQLLAALDDTNNTIRLELDGIARRQRVYGALDDLTAPGNWSAAQSSANAIAPHTARLRELLARPHLAVPFPGPEVEAALRAERAADFEENPPQEGAIVFDRGPMPVNHLEMCLVAPSGSHPISSAATHLRLELNYAIHTGNLGLALSNINSLFDAFRLQIEGQESLDTLLAISHEDAALSGIRSLLHRHGRRLRDATLESMQDTLLAHAERRRRTTEPGLLDVRIFVELLPTWFDPEQPDRLTERGQEFLSMMGWNNPWAELNDPEYKFSIRNPPPLDASFAPASEQIRVYYEMVEAFARDATRPWHARQDLESAQLFRTLVEADPQGRLAPALSQFTLYSSRSIGTQVRQEVKFRAALTMLAVHRHRARTGKWPELLAEIDPGVMRSDPIDPHSGEPFGYAVIDDQPTLWSAGPDRDNDDARPIPEPAGPDRDNDDGRPIPGPPAPLPGEFPEAPSRRWFTINEWNALPPEVQAEHDGDIPLFPPPAGR